MEESLSFKTFKNLLSKLGIKNRKYLDNKQKTQGKRTILSDELCTQVCSMDKKDSKMCTDPEVINIIHDVILSKDYRIKQKAKLDECNRIY